MRRIFTVSIDTDLEKAIDEYMTSKGLETRTEGAAQLFKKGLKYDADVKDLQSKLNRIHMPCSVCGKPFTISESDDDPIYRDMKKQYKTWGHSSCVESQKK